MGKKFMFREIECWLETKWIDGIFHFNFAPTESDYIDADGDTYFIHCTYEPYEEDKYWFSFWYEHDCIEPDTSALTEEEREYIKENIQNLVNQINRNMLSVKRRNRIWERKNIMQLQHL